MFRNDSAGELRRAGECRYCSGNRKCDGDDAQPCGASERDEAAANITATIVLGDFGDHAALHLAGHSPGTNSAGAYGRRRAADFCGGLLQSSSDTGKHLQRNDYRHIGNRESFDYGECDGQLDRSAVSGITQTEKAVRLLGVRPFLLLRHPSTGALRGQFCGERRKEPACVGAMGGEFS